MKENRQLCLLVADDSEVSVNIYIHLMEKKDPIILLNSRNSQVQLRQCIMQYQPTRIYVTAGQKAEWELVNIGYRMESEYSQYQIWIRTSNPAWLERISSELAVMLSKSGSTGSCKMVNKSVSVMSLVMQCDFHIDYVMMKA